MLMREGRAAHQSLTVEGTSQGLAFFRRVTEIAPDYADGWGALALAYAIRAEQLAPAEAGPLVARTRAAIDKANALEPGNGYAEGARAWLLPRLGRWQELEVGLRGALTRHPTHEPLASALAQMLASVGRMREAAATRDPIVKAERPTPILLWPYMVDLWAAGRLDEADRVADQAHTLFPLSFAVWFGRFYLLLYTGRADQAIAMADNVRGRPANIPAEEIAYVRDVARAFVDRTPANVGAVLRTAGALARQGSGHCENSIQFAAALGAVDLAFTFAEAYFFGRGFQVPSLRFPKGVPVHTAPEDRRSAILFLPSTDAMRTDPRFAALTSDLGLERYWRASGTQPDYRR
jgi:predicted Zn-dependent protease